ncbi:Similar to B1: Putative BEN domain-containing protein B1 (Microplitis demolitor bracovirus (isolate Webb)), partial [Cotesia congregata]
RRRTIEIGSRSIREQRGTFSLPAEYNPNNTKWTLKYREKARTRRAHASNWYLRQKERATTLYTRIKRRPGLDENARMVLLSFVEEHGKKRSWSTSNTSAVMSTIRTKIKDIRDKHERTCKA